MSGLTATAFSLSMLGVVAFVFVIALQTRVDKLINTLKERGILDENYKEK